MTGFSVDLKGRSAVVFGGSGGINLAIARRFAMAGAAVFVVSRDQERVGSAVRALRETAGEKVDGMAADVRHFEAVEAAAIRCASVHGAIDVVVSGAAGNFLAPAGAISANGFRTVVEIDLIGTFNVMRACYPHLKRPGASLISISAPQGAKAVTGQAHACAAKAGVNMLTRCLALEWGPEGIRSNAISPGPIADTEGMRRLAPETSDVTEITDVLPLRRFGTSDEIADAACFLASDAASYVNGIVLDVDGGTALGAGKLV